ncbi:MAG: hydrogenobyrinic acid a,c-diamide synthase (glutamine-hydrolyzing) [Chloroflexi bacterium]|nr:hydrogenobyrinic acid a,c-diamide synthase (glutamine-hydrolyzing) [Chloroflexota bacterium]
MPPRVVIAAPQGRSGKTTVTVGLCAALASRGLIVQPFKKGPDYIDPSWLSEAASRPCRNLDPFLMGRETVEAAFSRGARGADLAIIEGAMGMYDGADLEGSGSTAMLARWLAAPILLVVNAQRVTRSVAALVQGYQHFELDTRIAGVILNNVARARQQELMTQAIEKYCGIPVVGILPRDESLTIPDRHLGLVPRAENDALVPAIAVARDAVLANFDLDAILRIAGAEEQGITGAEEQGRAGGDNSQFAIRNSRIGIVRDRAFTFYYPENLDSLQDVGAELVFIDALRDAHLPALDALVIGGGFPEMFLDELQANTSLRADVRAAIENGLPVYAECGGLMYLARSITWNGKRGEMVGALSCDVEMTGKPQGHGYISIEVSKTNPFFSIGTQIRGHEFHNSRVTNLNDPRFAYHVTRGRGIDGAHDGIVYKNVLAAYTHVHALATPEWAGAIVAKAKTG